jgi:hypothetical protein
MLAAELNHGRGSRNAKAGLHGAGLVVDARVNHTAIVAALVASNAIFLFEQQETQAGKAARDFERNAEPYYATANDDYVISRIGH